MNDRNEHTIKDGDVVNVVNEAGHHVARVTLTHTGGGSFATIDAPVRCTGCEENDAYDDDPRGIRLCPTCVMNVHARIVLREVIDAMDDVLHDVTRAEERAREYDDANRGVGIQYVDIDDSAKDDMWGDKFDMRDRVVDLVVRAYNIVNDCPMTRR